MPSVVRKDRADNLVPASTITSLDAITLEDGPSIWQFRENMHAQFGEMQVCLTQMQASLTHEFDQLCVMQRMRQQRVRDVESESWLVLDERKSSTKQASTSVTENAVPATGQKDKFSLASSIRGSPRILDTSFAPHQRAQTQISTSSEIVKCQSSEHEESAHSISASRASKHSHRTGGSLAFTAIASKASHKSSGSLEPATQLEEAPECAFVINVRRLIKVQELLSLLHELLKSTAIAALTLVAGASIFQFSTTLIFIFIVFVIYAMHESDWDRMDVEDFRMLITLISDDLDPEMEIYNPNRIFKALKLASPPIWIWIRRLTYVVFLFMGVVGWVSLEAWWRVALDLEDGGGRKLREGFDALLIDSYLSSYEDAETLGMQMMVGSMMFLMQIIFEYILWRETTAVMPLTPSRETWDPRRNGTPLSYWLGGMPSMWFTSQDVVKKLTHYIDMANPGKNNEAFNPEELAYYALSGHDERCELQKALAEAKLFDACSQNYVWEAETNLPQALDIDLCFFDSKRQHKSFPYLGEFQFFVVDLPDTDDSHGNRRMALTTHSYKTGRGESGTPDTKTKQKNVLQRGLSNLFAMSTTSKRSGYAANN